MDTVLVTGASGFIAGHIVEALLRGGYRVRGTVRSLSDPARTAHLHALVASIDGVGPEALELVEADLLVPDGWARVIDGCARVLHTASPLPLRAPDDELELITPAVQGTRTVLGACATAGVDRVVLTSSSAAVIHAARPDDHVFTEADYSDPERCSPYPKSKTLAEQAAWEVQASTGLALSVVCPVLVLGPSHAPRLNASVEPVRRLLARNLPAVPRIGFSVVDVRDVARAHILAMERPEAAGQRYLLVDRFVWMREMARVLADAFRPRGLRIPTWPLPDLVLRIAGRFDPGVALVVDDLGRQRTLSSARAREELGWTTRPAEQSLVDTGESLLAHGLVPG